MPDYKDHTKVLEFAEKHLNYNQVTGSLTWIRSPSKNVKSGVVVKSCDKDGYLRLKIKGQSYKAHRIIWLMTHGYWPDQIDHINQNHSDNSIDNLRDVTVSENQKNKPTHKNNTSGLMGVHWNTKKRSWYARINENGTRVFLGAYKDFFEAACARKSAENSLNYHRNHGSN